MQFPDPWRRKKHLKRMLVQPLLVQQLAKHLTPGAIVYLSSDCFRVARWMRDRFMECEEVESVLTDQQSSDTHACVTKKCFRLVENIAAASGHMTRGAVIVLEGSHTVPIVPLKGPAPLPPHRLPQPQRTRDVVRAQCGFGLCYQV